MSSLTREKNPKFLSFLFFREAKKRVDFFEFYQREEEKKEEKEDDVMLHILERKR